MVHATQPHAPTTGRSLQLDIGRIGAQTGTLALNGALLLALLIPVAAPPLIDAARERDLDVILIAPPPKPPVVEARVVPKPDRVRPAPVATPRPVTRLEAPPVVFDDPQPGDAVVADVTPPADPATDDVGIDVTPATGAVLQYLSAPPPPYPRDALLGGLTGTVVLDVHVGVDGRPIGVTIATSSGHRVLDAAARRQVLARWRFVPAQRNGQAVEAIGRVPVDFVLDR